MFKLKIGFNGIYKKYYKMTLLKQLLGNCLRYNIFRFNEKTLEIMNKCQLYVHELKVCDNLRLLNNNMGYNGINLIFHGASG